MSNPTVRINVLPNTESLFALFVEKYSVSTFIAMEESASSIAVFSNKVYVRYSGKWRHIITFNSSTKRYFIVVDNFLEILSYLKSIFNSELDPETISGGSPGQLLFYGNFAYIYDGAWHKVFSVTEVTENSLPPALSGELSLPELENRMSAYISQRMQEIMPVFVGAMRSTINEQKGKPDGLASLGNDSKVTATQLPESIISGDIE